MIHVTDRRQMLMVLECLNDIPSGEKPHSLDSSLWGEIAPLQVKFAKSWGSLPLGGRKRGEGTMGRQISMSRHVALD